MNKKIVLNSLAGFLLVMFAVNTFFIIKDGTWVNLFWLSNHVALVMGIAILMRNSYLLTAEVCLAFVGEIGWTLDFVFFKLFNVYILGSTAYLNTAGYPVSLYWTSMSHLFLIPVGLVALFLIKKPEPFAWHATLPHILVLVLSAMYFGKYYNLNCVLESCVSWLPNFGIYTLIWGIGYFLVFILPVNVLLVWLLRKTV